MAQNRMEEVARLLGLELEEEFRMDNWSTKYKLTKDGFMYWSDGYQQWNYISGIEELFTGERQITKIPKPILNEKEKEYLSAVIKQFRDRRVSICKTEVLGYELICIALEYPKKMTYKNAFRLPFFERGTMYKGMKLDKEYTLKELEL